MGGRGGPWEGQAPRRLDWHYVDPSGREFGPFGGDAMRNWFEQGFFSVAGGDLLVRLPEWPSHRPLCEVYGGDKAAYFVGEPLPVPRDVAPLPPHHGHSPRRHGSRSPARMSHHAPPPPRPSTGPRPPGHPPHGGPPPHDYGPPPPDYGPASYGPPPGAGGYALAVLPPGPPPPAYHSGPPPPSGGYGYGLPPPAYGAPPHGGPPPCGYQHFGSAPPGPPPPLPISHGYGPSGPGYGHPNGYHPYYAGEGRHHSPPRKGGKDEGKKGGGRRGGKGGKGGNNENFQLNRRIIKLSEQVTKGERVIGDLLADIDETLAQMNEVNLSTAFHRVAKLSRGNRGAEIIHDPRFVRLQRGVRAGLLGSLEWLDGSGSKKASEVPMSAACVCWAHASMRLPDQGLFSEVARYCAPHLGDFKHIELANLLWSFAKLGEKGKWTKELFAAAAMEVEHRPDGFSVVNLSTLAWSYATARVKNPTLFRLVAKAVVENAWKAESQEIANTLWAFATAGVAAEEGPLCAVMGDEAVKKLGSFKVQEAANVAWAFGRAEVSHISFFEALEASLRTRAAQGALLDFEPQHLAMVLWAAASLYWPEEDAELDGAEPDTLRGRAAAQSLAVTLMPECLRQVQRFKCEEAARILRACVRLRLRGNAAEKGPLAVQAKSFYESSDLEQPLEFGEWT